jgi:hypothetical protein
MSPIKEPCYFAPEVRLSFFGAKFRARAECDGPPFVPATPPLSSN